MKVAFAGKGGVGKTFVTSGIAWSLSRSGQTVIAIDADPSPNLAIALGVSEREAATIVPLSENNALVEKKTKTGYPGVYNLNFSVDDVIRDFSRTTPAGVHLLVMGTVKSMGSGCTCPANSLVRALLRHLIVERDEAVVLDSEAGVEHLGRGTAEGVDIMVVVTDANRRSLEVATTIGHMAQDAGIPSVALVGNRVRDDVEREVIERSGQEHHIPVLGCIPFDADVASAGIQGEPVTSLGGTAAFRALEVIAAKVMGAAGRKEARKEKEVHR